MESPKSSEMEIEVEALKLKEIQNLLAKTLEAPAAKPKKTLEEQKEVDAKSVYVGNVDWYSTTEELEKHFAGCGPIVRITIPKDMRTQRQKNFAYVEFENAECVQLALHMNGSVFRNRPIVVTTKRTNIPGMSAHGAQGRGDPRGGAGRPQVVIKYVHINALARGGYGAPRGRRFAPY